MISLFIDTSFENVSISLVKDNKILSSICKCIPNMHSVYTTSFVKQVLDNSNIDANQIDNIMVVNGPGSFTGIRIGVTIAKTYGYLIKKYITPVSSLKMLAISANYDNCVLTMIPANKNNYYVSVYDKDYNNIYPEEFMSRDKVIGLIDKYNPYIVSVNTSVIGNYKINKVELDVLKIVDYYKEQEKVNYHKIVPNYLKLPQALEDRK